MNEKKKYVVYYNDEVNEPADVYTADTLDECKQWISNQLDGVTPVDEDHPCSDSIMYSAKTYCYEVYDRPIVEDNGSEFADDWTYNEPVFTTGYYYTD